ncbi:MAG: hypothetical protein NXI15_06550 [Gammaproteobacteria bacterium]|nr:hypothetical protein [Gammaproteobacteria bacterium]
MIKWGGTLLSRAAVFLAFLFALTACGGGGGGGGFFVPSDDGEGQLTLQLFDPQGNPTSIVTASSPGSLRALVAGEGANLVVNVESTIGDIFPTTGTALTDSNGVATFQVEAGDERGAGTITATVTLANGLELAATLNIQVGATGLRIGRLEPDGTFIENEVAIEPASTLAATGNAQLSVIILDEDGKRITTSEEVRFNSGCIAAGQATINPENPTTSINGQASTLYTAAGCTGIDEVTASLVGAGAQAFGTLSIASPEANAVLFVSAEPDLIVLRGTGGQNRQETSQVTFQVADGAGQPLQGITVNFALTTDVGGLALTTASALSNGEGQVSTIVQAGDVATSVRVIATVDDGSGNPVSTVSDILTVTTGLPDQNSISLAISETFVVANAFDLDGETRTLTVSMADKFNNPVVDGTSAVFTTEYGAIVGSCTTLAGVCSVQWRSQEPRFPTLTGTSLVKTIFDDDYDCPGHNGAWGPCLQDLGFIRGQRSAILVHALGEESFIDRNGNGVLDQDEANLFDNLPEAFIDHNEDGVYTPADPQCLAAPETLRCIAGQEEIFVDLNGNNTYDNNDDPAVYNGLLCPPEGDGVWCSRELVNVFASNIAILSDGLDFSAIMVRGGNVVSTTRSRATQQVLIADTFNNRPPGGSTVSVAVRGDCKLLSRNSFEIANTAAYGAFGFELVTDFPDTFNDEPGVVSVTLNAVDNPPAIYEFACEEITDPCGFSPQPDFCDDPDPMPMP